MEPAGALKALLALGRLAGLELSGTARGELAALIRELGATPIDYQREDFTRVLPGGFDVVFDGIGEEGSHPESSDDRPRCCAKWRTRERERPDAPGIVAAQSSKWSSSTSALAAARWGAAERCRNCGV